MREPEVKLVARADFTLRERANYQSNYAEQIDDNRNDIQGVAGCAA